MVKSHVVAQNAAPGWDFNIKNDLKNVITEHRVSSQLLIGDPPSLLDCVQSSRTCRDFTTQHENRVWPLPDEITPESFLPKSEDKKVMDYLALRGLLGAEAAYSYETGRLTRGFTIVYDILSSSLQG